MVTEPFFGWAMERMGKRKKTRRAFLKLLILCMVAAGSKVWNALVQVGKLGINPTFREQPPS
jgi:hypothetical protein